MFGEISASHRVTPAFQYGEAVLPSTYAITAATGSFVDTGLHLPLPSAGTYLIGMNIRAHVSINATTNGFIVTKLFRTDTSLFVTNSERFCIIDDATSATFYSQNIQNESGYTIPVSVNAACNINLYAKRDGGATTGQYVASDILSDSNGWTSLNYMKIG